MDVVPPHSHQATLRELRDFTERCQSRLTAVLSDWGWEPGGEGDEQETVVCPYDSNHRMPSSCLEKHVSVCRLRQLGYSKEEAEAYDPQFYYEKAKVPSVVLDKNKQFQVIKEAQDMAPSTSEDSSWDKNSYSSSPVEVPVTHERAICDLKPADRLAIYDYVLQKTKEEKSVASINEADLFEDLTAKIKHDDDQKCPKSHLEIIAEMRDYKRRRQSYRAKNVHITKKSYTEIIRDVINVHMEEFNSNWRDEMHDEASSSVSSSSVKRREQQRSPSVESRQSRGSQRDKHRSGRRRKRSRSPQRQRSRDRDRSSRHRERNEDRRHSHKKKKKEDD